MNTQELKTKELLPTFIAEYNFSDYLHRQIEYFQGDKQEFLVSILFDEDTPPENISDNDVENHFENDYFLSEVHWEDFENQLEDEFTQHIDKEVRVEGFNMGWRNRSGHKEFTISKPIDVFKEIAPKCDLTFKIDKLSENKYTIRISHHDSPMGEHYELTIM